MRIPYLALLACVAILKLLALSTSYIWPIIEQDSYPKQVTLSKPVSYVEQQFALGNKIALSEADLYDLELITGVSDTLGLNILKAREKILTFDKTNTDTKKMSPFEMAHGVGEKVAKKLEKYLLAK